MTCAALVESGLLAGFAILKHFGSSRFLHNSCFDIVCSGMIETHGSDHKLSWHQNQGQNTRIHIDNIDTILDIANLVHVSVSISQFTFDVSKFTCCALRVLVFFGSAPRSPLPQKKVDFGTAPSPKEKSQNDTTSKQYFPCFLFSK